MKKTLKLLAAAALLGISMTSAASAAAIISNGVIQLGVDNFGQLNVPGGVPSPVTGTTTVGLRYIPTGNESTAHGCLCEGWGVGIAGGGGSGSANNNFGGAAGLTLVSFGSTATTAKSVVDMGTSLRVTHDFAPSAATSNLYEVKVSITNTSGADIADLRYTRTFDWDVEPTTFRDIVTIQGVATTPTVLSAINDGFVNSNPFAARPSGSVFPVVSGDFIDNPVNDQGANFDFSFGLLKAGESYNFSIFYGAALTEKDALLALGSVGAELYSLGQSSCDAAGLGTVCPGSRVASNTFIFGFKGVGGDPIVTPIPGAALLLMSGLGALGVATRRRQKAA